ncbi:hypothetical protein CTheo_7113 [Ceratobasidium theobromae]|uniref:Cyanovirin-N domain-containing protein n=1 Tax=Ceratobasidium theobromae TaxID=1582974 RepID=A0A5N5QCG8_9AGAM|nr:hypothetical protein CTheo_7113 [Ceratobasidium theobromae]
MHFTNLLAFAGASLVAVSGVQAANNFGTTCNSITMTSNNVLRASCRKVNGSYSTSTLDLNRCVVNNSGNLGCQSNGNYAYSCNYCGLVGSGSTTMSCQCSPGGHYTTLNLNNCVGNNDGSLTC